MFIDITYMMISSILTVNMHQNIRAEIKVNFSYI